MFRELTMEEKYETEGGAWPLVVKIIVYGLEVIFCLGAMKGCSAESTEDNNDQ